MEQTSETVITSYTCEVPTTPAVDNVTVVIKTTVENDVATTRLQISCTTPYYVSVDCAEADLSNAIAMLTYVQGQLTQK